MNYKTFINLEPTNACNYKCSKCLHSQKKNPLKIGFLTRDKAEKIVDKLSDNIEYIGLSGIGEPLLNPNFFEIIDLIHSKLPNVNVGFHTNGSLLTNENIKNICERKIYDISISIDATTDSTYKKIHNTSYELESIINNTLKLKKELYKTKNKMYLSVSYVIQKENLGELSLFISKMHSLGFKNIGPINVISPIHGYDMSTWETPFEDVKKEIENAKTIVDKLNIKVILPNIFEEKAGSTNIDPLKNYSCSFPISLYPVISWEGQVFPCVWLHDISVSTGNIFVDSMEEILEGKKIKRIRTIFETGKYLKLCEKCKTKGFPFEEMEFEKI